MDGRFLIQSTVLSEFVSMINQCIGPQLGIKVYNHVVIIIYNEVAELCLCLYIDFSFVCW